MKFTPKRNLSNSIWNHSEYNMFRSITDFCDNKNYAYVKEIRTANSYLLNRGPEEAVGSCLSNYYISRSIPNEVHKPK